MFSIQIDDYYSNEGKDVWLRISGLFQGGMTLG